MARSRPGLHCVAPLHRLNAVRQAKAAVLMLSAEFLADDLCVETMLMILENPSLAKKTVAVLIYPVNIDAVKYKVRVKLERLRHAGMFVPAADGAVFTDDWDANVVKLVEKVKKLLA